MTQFSKTKRLVESAIMLAVATVLSFFPLAELPYGGSITVASMFPILLVAWRHGLLWGFGTGLAYGVIQQLLGLKNLSYFTTWQSIVAIILLDYLVAFAVIGLGGAFRRTHLRQSTAMGLGALLVGVARYTCHVISGATVWAGLSIPTEAALLYSFAYNATYMLPETLVLVVISVALGSTLDFTKESPVRITDKEPHPLSADVLAITGVVLSAAALVYDIVAVFSHTQNAETGDFDFALLGAVPFAESFWVSVVIVTAIGVALTAAAFVARFFLLKKKTA